MCHTVLCIGAVVENFHCNGACNGTCVGNLVQCYCKTTTPLLTWDINGTNIQRFDFIKSDNANKEGQGFQATYDNVLYSSNLTFTVNETADLHIMCINGGVQSSNKSCTVRDSGNCYIEYFSIFVNIIKQDVLITEKLYCEISRLITMHSCLYAYSKEKLH